MAEDVALILIVEDDPDIRSVVQLALKLDGGLSVVAVEKGEAALEKLRAGLKPALILIDAHLPDMDGVALAQAVSLIDAATPFAFLTASVRASERERYIAAGALSVIPKPFDPLTLADQVKSLLSLT